MQNGISKDRPQIIKKIEYLTDKNTVDYKKKIAESNITKDALKLYDPKIAAIAFVPSIDNTNSYYMSRTKTAFRLQSKSAGATMKTEQKELPPRRLFQKSRVRKY